MKTLRPLLRLLSSSLNSLSLSFSSVPGSALTECRAGTARWITDNKVLVNPLEQQSSLWYHQGQAGFQSRVNDNILTSLNGDWEKLLPSCWEQVWSLPVGVLYFQRQWCLWRQGSQDHLPCAYASLDAESTEDDVIWGSIGLSLYVLEHKSDLPPGSWPTRDSHKYQINFPLSIYHRTCDLEVSLPSLWVLRFLSCFSTSRSMHT